LQLPRSYGDSVNPEHGADDGETSSRYENLELCPCAPVSLMNTQNSNAPNFRFGAFQKETSKINLSLSFRHDVVSKKTFYFKKSWPAK